MLKPTSSYILVLFSIFFVILSCSKLETEDNQDDFVKYFGGSKRDSACDMMVTPDGGYILTGQITANTGIPQAVFIRTDPFGNQLPYSPILLGQGKPSTGHRICPTKDGSSLVVGSIYETSSKYDILLRKINSEGVLIWSKNIGTLQNDEGFCVKELKSGDILIGGYTESLAGKKKEAWILKLNASGEIIWSNTFGGTNNDICFDVMERDNYYLLTGSTESFQYTDLKKSVFLVQIDKSSGNGFAAVWYGGANNEAGVKSIADDSNNIYILANSNSSDGTSGIYLLKFKDDNFYQPEWEKYIVSEKNDTGNDLIVIKDKLVLTGTSNFGTDADFLIYQLDTQGNILNTFSNTLIAKGNQLGQKGIVDANGQIVLAGTNVVETFSRIALVKTKIPQ